MGKIEAAQPHTFKAPNGKEARLYHGDAIDVLKTLRAKSCQTCVTSPPYYGTRDYGSKRQIGVENTIEDYIERLVEVFQQVRRVLRDDGTLWLNLGDIYARGAQQSYLVKSRNQRFSQKDLVGMPWRVAFALQADGWILRNDICWHKVNAQPTSTKDRCTMAHEYIFLLAKQKDYFYDRDAILEPLKTKPHSPGSKSNGRLTAHSWTSGMNDPERIWGDAKGKNKRTVWSVSTKPFKGSHFAVMAPEIAETCILAGSKKGRRVLDPFSGTGTTGIVSLRHGRAFTGIDISKRCVNMSLKRFGNDLVR